MRAAANTPAETVGACVAHFPTAGSLPRVMGGSASASQVSGPARRSLALRPAWSLSHPGRPLVVGVLQPMSLPPSSAPTATGWSDSCRAGFAPAEEWRLLTAHHHGLLTPAEHHVARHTPATPFVGLANTPSGSRTRPGRHPSLPADHLHPGRDTQPWNACRTPGSAPSSGTWFETEREVGGWRGGCPGHGWQSPCPGCPPCPTTGQGKEPPPASHQINFKHRTGHPQSNATLRQRDDGGSVPEPRFDSEAVACRSFRPWTSR